MPACPCLHHNIECMECHKQFAIRIYLATELTRWVSLCITTLGNALSSIKRGDLGKAPISSSLTRVLTLFVKVDEFLRTMGGYVGVEYRQWEVT